MIGGHKIDLLHMLIKKHIPDFDSEGDDMGFLRWDVHDHPLLRTVEGYRSVIVDEDWESNSMKFVLRWAAGPNGRGIICPDDIEEIPACLVQDLRVVCALWQKGRGPS